jgi:predicted  nucleic acid-binding Zn-ribbon protein
MSAVAMLLLFTACGQKGGGTVKSQMETAQQISKLEKEIDTRQQEMNTLLTTYVHSGGQDVGTLVGQGLTPEQTKILEQRLKNEQGVAYRDLLADILNKQQAIEDMQVKVQDLERALPSPVDVARGQRHFDIAMSYLTKDKGLDANAAKKLVQQVNLMDELVPGFKVWNFYKEGVYGTFVTQGEARVSPYGVIQHAKQTLINEKNTAVTERDGLARDKAALNAELADLTAKRDQLTQDVTLLQAEREELNQKVSSLQGTADDLQSQMNSVFYRIGYRKSMVSEGYVQSHWYGKPVLAKFAEADYPQRLDLRSSDAISFTAADAGVPQIRRVRLAPGSSFKEGTDYAVSIAAGGDQATVQLLNKSKFRAARSMMVVVN